MIQKEQIMCDKHPRYKAINKPRSKCITCWKEYAQKHPDKEYSNKDIVNIVFAMDQKITELKRTIESKIEDYSIF